MSLDDAKQQYYCFAINSCNEAYQVAKPDQWILKAASTHMAQPD